MEGGNRSVQYQKIDAASSVLIKIVFRYLSLLIKTKYIYPTDFSSSKRKKALASGLSSFYGMIKELYEL